MHSGLEYKWRHHCKLLQIRRSKHWRGREVSLFLFLSGQAFGAGRATKVNKLEKNDQVKSISTFSDADLAEEQQSTPPCPPTPQTQQAPPHVTVKKKLFIQEDFYKIYSDTV